MDVQQEEGVHDALSDRKSVKTLRTSLAINVLFS